MPEHTSFLSYLIAMFPALGENMHNFGATFLGKKPVDAHGAEPIAASLLVVLIILFLAWRAKAAVTDYEKSVIPDEKLSLRTFFEIFIGYFYNMMKDMMGPKRAKRYFPVVGTAACFVFFSNVLGMIPGFLPPTATWNITAGCALVVLVAFTFYGLKAQGTGFITHLAGPWMGPAFLPINILIFAIEFISTFVIRPVTLSIRLMLNIAVDHLLLSILLGIFTLFLPLPIMILGTLVAVVQVLVFCLLTSIYISLATEVHHGDDHGHDDEHGHGEKAHA
ncbi:MAG: F0F1 ATP synthase subunit A [Labilithrix sp.]|nr:F0F1 ATP synthase subunit A [Labilithrix sp.]MCW5834271.1 F0F1 ATP synthase subunit A [Labilithrix sp.]